MSLPQPAQQVKKRMGSYPRVRAEGGGRTVVSQAGGVLLVETVHETGPDSAISAALTPWRKSRAVHDPGKILLDVALAASGEKAPQVIRAARAEIRRHVWRLTDGEAPDAGGTVAVDLDGVLVIAHSDKEDAAPTWKRTYGHHLLMGFVDHGPGGTGEPVAALLRPGNAGSNTAADRITAAPHPRSPPALPT